MKTHLIEKGVRLILQGMEVDLKDSNFAETPDRYTRFICEMFSKPEIDYATFPETYSDFILFKNHEMWSLCPHHLIPVQFYVSLAYIPDGEVLGLSKLVRVLDETNNRPLLQERFTKGVIAKMYENIPRIKGAACLVDGQHGCTRIRGVRSDGRFITYSTEGRLKEAELERRFFELVLHESRART